MTGNRAPIQCYFPSMNPCFHSRQPFQSRRLKVEVSGFFIKLQAKPICQELVLGKCTNFYLVFWKANSSLFLWKINLRSLESQTLKNSDRHLASITLWLLSIVREANWGPCLQVLSMHNSSHPLFVHVVWLQHQWWRLKEVNKNKIWVLTVGDTFILDFEVFVCSRTRIRKHIWPSNYYTLSSVVAPVAEQG